MKFSVVLFLIGWMSVVASDDGPPSDCCLYVSDTRIPAENIVKYDMQEKSPCPVRAVIFHTKKSKTICSDPESKWAKRVMEIVDQRTITPPKCFTRTTNTIPTSTNKTPGPETETSTSATAPPEETRIETRRPKPETSTTTSKATSVTKEKPTPSSSVRTCGTRGPTASPTPKTPKTPKTPPPETEISTTTSRPPPAGSPKNPTSKTPGKRTVLTTEIKNTVTIKATRKTTKPSKLRIKKRRKSRKQLKKYQMSHHHE